MKQAAITSLSQAGLLRLPSLLLIVLLTCPGIGWALSANSIRHKLPAGDEQPAGTIRDTTTASVGGAEGQSKAWPLEATPNSLAPLADLTENFEVGSKDGFATANVSLASGEWTFTDALIASVSDANLGSGSKTARIREKGFLAMNFDKPNGAGIITLKAAAYNNSTATAENLAKFIVQVFDNGATMGAAIYTSPPVTVTTSLQTYTFAANVSGNIRVKITSQDVATNSRFNVDDITISSIGNQAANSCTWTGQANNGSWSDAANWSPARTVPMATDILIFDANVARPVAITLDFPAPTQIIGQLQLRNLVSVTFLNSDAPRTLSLDGGLAGDDLTIGAGSVLTLRGASGAAIVLNITAGETALINGRIASETTGSGSGAANKLTGQTVGAIVFGSGALFEVEAGVTESPFGGAAANRQSVLFKAGATFRQKSGGSAFGLSQPGAVAVFESGSLYQFAVPSSTPSLSGRTYGILELANGNAGLVDLKGTAPLVIQNNLRVGANVKVGLNLTGGIRISENIVVEAGGSLEFSPATASTVTLNGTQEQTINGPSFIRFGAQTTLSLDNAAGVRLQAPIRVNGTLDLQNGVLTTSAINLLTLAATATVTGGSATNYVSGPVARQLSVGTTDPQLFPVGDAGNYRPVTIVPSTITAVSTIMVEQHEGQPTPLAFNDGLKRVSRLRRYSISASPALSAAQFAGTVTLSFDPNDQVTNPAAASLVIARTDGTGWKSLGRSTSTGPAGTPTAPFVAGTLTSAPFAGLEIFGTYTLASTDPDENNNPLPVQLLSFGAERQAVGVQVRWATATEQNSASFEVQRSATGQQFRTIATVAAQGNSSSAHSYAALDWQPLHGLSYYRLRQLDLDGREAYSTVVSVSTNGQLRVYPNPATSALTVEAPSAGARYRILSLLGSAVRVGEMPTGIAVLDVATLPAGVYQLEVTMPAGRSTSRFIKQ